MLDADDPKIVQDRSRIGSDLCADGRPLIEGIRGAAGAGGLDDQLNGALAVNVDNAVSVPAENERAVNVRGGVGLRVAKARVVGPDGGVRAEGSRGGQGDGRGVAASRVYSVLPT